MNVIILAAGKGTRMKSDLPKACHTILEKPMINYIVDTFEDFKKYVVVGFNKEKVKSLIQSEVTFVTQEEQLGTGHAVMCVEELRNKSGITFVVNGDLPFVSKQTVLGMVDEINSNGSKLVLLSANKSNPKGFGRLIKGNDNNILGIVEEKDATDAQKLIEAVNVGMYAFDNEILFEYLDKLTTNNSQKEYYLTDLIKIFIENNYKVTAVTCSEIESMSANDKLELAEMEETLRKDIIKKHLLNGVSISGINSVVIGPDVKIGRMVTIKDSSHITGKVDIKDGVVIGPMARIREKAVIGQDSVIGNFVEVKNSIIGKNSKAMHHAYLGDSEIGDNVNIGCGVITANFDGREKHKTIIENNVFVGSNVTLIAPIKVEENAFIAAGSTVSKEIEKNKFVIERAELKVKDKK